MIRRYIAIGMCTLVMNLLQVFAQSPNTIFLNASPQRDREDGDRSASANLRTGYRLLMGVSLGIDKERAAGYFAKAARQTKSPTALSWLGFTYALASDPKTASSGVAILRTYANTGDPVAKTLLGRLCAKGIALPLDVAAARQFLAEAAPAFALANTYLAETYLYSSPPDASKYQLAHGILLKAATAGETRSMVDLAFIHIQGLDGPKDLKRAVYWLERAAQRGDCVAIYQRGSLYAKGWGSEQNQHLAATMYQRAASMGYAPAQTALAMCYMHGIGVAKDEKMAKTLLSQAANTDAFAAKQLFLFINKGGR